MPSVPPVLPRGRPPALVPEQILDAVEQSGLRGFTVAEVARTLGVRDSTIYNYFPTRTELAKKTAARALTRARLRFDELPDWVDYLIAVNLELRTHTSAVPGLAQYYLNGPYSPEMVQVFDTQIAEVSKRLDTPGGDQAARNYAFVLASFASTNTLNLLPAPDVPDAQVREILASILPALHAALGGKPPAGLPWDVRRAALLGETPAPAPD